MARRVTCKLAKKFSYPARETRPPTYFANLLNALISLGTKEVGGIWHRLAKRVNMCKGRGGAMQLLLGLNLKELPYMTYTNFKVCFFWSLDIKDNLIKV